VGGGANATIAASLAEATKSAAAAAPAAAAAAVAASSVTIALVGARAAFATAAWCLRKDGQQLPPSTKYFTLYSHR